MKLSERIPDQVKVMSFIFEVRNLTSLVFETSETK